jgi:WD40 repeat protein
MTTPANTITSPEGLDPGSPGALFSLLPLDEADDFDLVQDSGTLITPLLEKDRLLAITRTRLLLIDYPYGIEEPADEVALTSAHSASVAEVSGWAVTLVVRPQVSDVSMEIVVGPIVRTAVLRTFVKVVAARDAETLVSVAHYNSPYVSFYTLRSPGVMTKLTGPAQLPTSYAYESLISPDGGLIAYQERTQTLRTIAYSNGTLTHLPDIPDADMPLSSGQFAFSRRGQYLVATHYGESPYLNVYRRAGNTLQLMANVLDVIPTARTNSADYSPDDAFLAINYERTVRVYRREGERYTSVASFTVTGSLANLVSWSPDGKYLACSTNASPYLHLLEFDKQALTLTDVRAAKGISLIGVPASVCWSPQGNYLSMARLRDFMLYRRTGDTFTAVTTGLPTWDSTHYSHAWSYRDDYLVMFKDFDPNIVAWKVNTNDNSFTQIATPTSPGGSGVGYNTLSIYPGPDLIRTRAANATTAVLTRPQTNVVASSVFVNVGDQTVLDIMATPRLGRSPVTSAGAGWTQVHSGYLEESFVGPITLPFNLTIAGTSSNQAYVSSHGYISMGSGSGLESYQVDLPKVLPADYWSAVWEVFVKASDNFVTIRYQGNSYQTPTADVRDINWEVTFVRPAAGTGNQMIEARLGRHYYADWSEVGVYDGFDLLGSVWSVEDTSHVMTSDSTGAEWTVETGKSLAYW